MEREPKILTPEEQVSRILNLPLERIEYLKTECGMPVADPEFSEWFVDHAEFILEEMKANFERLLFPRELRPELVEPAAWSLYRFTAHVAIEANDFAFGDFV